MFAVIYQIFVKPEAEQEYQTLWEQIGSYFVKHRGALGSTLHRANNGYWIAYSRWPDKATRDASWPGENAPSTELPDNIREAIIKMRNCVDSEKSLPEIQMNVINSIS